VPSRPGRAAAEALEAGGATPLVWDDDKAARAEAKLRGYPATDLSRAGVWDDIAALIVSPGIAHLYPEAHKTVAAAINAGVAIDNDIGLFFRSFATADWERMTTMPRVIAVTGSNGKSTTCALIRHILEVAGKPVQMAGNIGRGVLDLAPARDGEVVVLELSSYQSELARALTPDIAVFTNLTPDHLERHGGIGGYFAAKRRLFAEGGPDRAVIGVDEAEGRYLANQLAEDRNDARVIRISGRQKLAGSGWSVFARKGFLAEYRHNRQVASIDLRAIRGLPGAHNHQNACAAYAAVRGLGLAPRLIETAFATFEGLAHRSQHVAQIGGVNFVNDSKATNVDSAAMALQAFSRVRWIVGGQGKHGGIQALAPHLAQVSKAYLIGASAAEFATQLGDTPHEICTTMARAVERAASEALSGDTVLLAPAAASFDQYEDFEARGDDFIALVQKLVQKPAQ
ncbi:MAG: UDP-N-acetylmuramoyl-L-alanine--D-glutamate ligase, partial [Paracoccaceae bacterium]